MNKKYLKNLILETSESRALFLLIVLQLLRLKRAIPFLRPRQIIVPVTIAQILAFILAARHPSFLILSALANLIIVGIALIPSTYPRPIQAHWVRPYYEKRIDQT